MKLVNKSILAVIITAVCAPAFAFDSIESAATELQAINPGMTHAEIDQKINRFMSRTGMVNQDATDYLVNNGYMDEHGNTIYPTAATTAEPGHFILTHSAKVEAPENITGNQLQRTMINHMERREAEQHEARFAGMTHERSIYDVLEDEHDASRKAAAEKYKKPQVTVSAAPTATHSQAVLRAQFAALKAAQEKDKTDGLKKLLDNRSRTATQHVNASDVRELAQDSAIAQVQHDAAWNSVKADDAHHAIMVAQIDIDKNTTDIKTNADAIATNSKLIHHAQTNADAALKGNLLQSQSIQANAEAISKTQDAVAGNAADITTTANKLDKVESVVAGNTADITTTANKLDKVESVVAGNAADIKTNADDISKVNRVTEQQQHMLTSTTAKTDGLAAQSAIQNSDRVQGMLHARQEAEIKTAVASVKPSTVTTVKPADHNSEITANRTAIKSTQRDVKALVKQQHIDSVHYGEQIQTLANNAAGALNEQADAINANTRSINSARSQVSDNTQSINKLNSNFSSLKNQVEDNRKEANAGTASAMAFASQPQVKNGDSMMVSAGAGTFNGESAVSVGASFNAGEHTVIKAGVTADTQSDFGAGVGVGYSF